VNSNHFNGDDSEVIPQSIFAKVTKSCISEPSLELPANSPGVYRENTANLNSVREWEWKRAVRYLCGWPTKISTGTASPRFFWAYVLWIAMLLAPSSLLASPCQDADLIVEHGHIVTMDLKQSIVTSLAIRDGKILAVGSDADLAACASSRTQIIDLRGQTVLPGLIDIHTHASEWAKGIVMGVIDLSYPDVRSMDDVVKAVGSRAKNSKPGAWIFGTEWDDAKLTEKRYITRQDLDPVSANNPVILTHISGHLLTLNSAAMKIAGVTKSSPNPQGGVIEHDASGEPTGVMKDMAMDLLLGRLGPIFPKEGRDVDAQAAKLVSERAAAVGLTSIHDINPTPGDIRGYEDAYQKGWLNIRVQVAPLVEKPEDADFIARMGAHTGFGNDHLKYGAVKMYADGGMGARTIAIYPPGVIGEPENVGLLRWKTEDMQKAEMTVAAAGWQIETHAIGDRAIDQVLDCYAAVIKQLNLKDARFRIVHAGISTPAIQKRLKELNVLVDGNPPFVYWIGSWFRKYGDDRMRWMYPAKSFIDNGIIEGAGSDVSVTPISPWWGIWAAVVRKEILTGEVIAPEERITIQQALTLYTRNGAYVGFEENQKGSLEPGKFADFIVIDRDVLSVPSDEIKDVKVRQTYIGGKLVYDGSGAGN
jgi:predicted amidohydrolase YtcJ